MDKTNLLFLDPGPIYKPNSPQYKDKFTILSQSFEGVIITMPFSEYFQNYKMGKFLFCGIGKDRMDFLNKVTFGVSIIIKSIYFNFKRNRIDLIVTYDPMFTGVLGVFLKIFLRCKLIIEINSSSTLKAVALEERNLIKKFFIMCLYRFLIYFSLNCTDSIKLLNKRQIIPFSKFLKNKKFFYFNDFVPTHCFIDTPLTFQKVLLFAGWPFYRKGVDILMKAFQVISDKYPDFILRLVGHQLKRDAKFYLRSWNNKIQFYPAIDYDRLKDEFAKCYCFILPSREEGMGKVLLEAMASGKPVIGSNVGGIPEIIEDGKNGFLFKSENVQDLALKLDILLSNPKTAREMGEYGRKLVKEKFSSDKYYENFINMIEKTLNQKNVNKIEYQKSFKPNYRI